MTILLMFEIIANLRLQIEFFPEGLFVNENVESSNLMIGGFH